MKLNRKELRYILEGLSVLRDKLKEEEGSDFPNSEAYYEVWDVMDKVKVEWMLEGIED
jgi:hypothetical protein